MQGRVIIARHVCLSPLFTHRLLAAHTASVLINVGRSRRRFPNQRLQASKASNPPFVVCLNPNYRLISTSVSCPFILHSTLRF